MEKKKGASDNLFSGRYKREFVEVACPTCKQSKIICLPEELNRLGEADRARQVKCIFCAKEAVFKAQAALHRAMFGHEILAVTLAGADFDAQAIFIDVLQYLFFPRHV